MVTKYCQYEVLNFADKLHIQSIPFKLLLFQTLQNTINFPIRKIHIHTKMESGTHHDRYKNIRYTNQIL